MVDFAGKRIYKWWTDGEGKGASLYIWSILGKDKLYRHLIRARGIEERYGDTICRLALRLVS